ncbi:MAG: amino acid adenylation domain-containing protein [Candidatus Aminicenantes bacterium]|nr:MAG: amino acid adenylation domain-containing protein [Candidatus Aminicenantes bacterium]
MKIKASYHQERLWFIHQFESEDIYEGGPIYHNIPLILEITGSLDINRLEQCISRVIQRHRALRTRMITVENQLFQQVEPKIGLNLQVLNLPGGSSGLEMALKEAKRPFTMEGESLVRAAVIKTSIDKNILVITLHHLAADQYSLGIIATELALCYQALQEGSLPELPDVRLHYADFSQWQRELPPDFQEDLLLYWKRQLTNISPLALPTRVPRAVIHTFREARIAFRIPPGLSTRIREFCQQKGTGNQVFLLAAFKVLLHRYCCQEDIVVGTSVDNRHQPGSGALVGPTANLLVLRSSITGNMSFNTFFYDLIQTLKQAYENQDIPFDLLAMKLNPQKDMSRTVFFDVLFQYREEPLHIPPVKGLKINYIETNLGWGKYDLNLFIRGGERSFSGVLVYNKDYYDEWFASCFMEHYTLLLENILREPHQLVSHLGILNHDERHRLLTRWNQTHAGYPGDKTIEQLFEAQAAKTPGSAALVYRDRTLTYRELDSRASRLASYLQELYRIVPGDLIGIMMERSQELIAGLLAILKAGGAYLPIDPAYPRQRINYILADSRPKVLLAGPGIRAKVEFKEKLIEMIEISNLSFSSSTLTSTLRWVNPANAAYVIYTSGSTGWPKGCMITHLNLVRLFKNDRLPFHFDNHDIWIMAHSFCFDFSVWEMYGALLNGGRLIVPPPDHIRDINLFLLLLKRHQVSILNQTPHAFYALAETEKKSQEHSLNQHLRTIIFGGDKLLPQNLSGWSDRYSSSHIQLVNMYGITETTVHVTYYRLKDSDIRSLHGISPIGKPLPETTLYILDNLLNPVPMGISGEIFVGGTGVARGYLNQPELTSERFIEIDFKVKKKKNNKKFLQGGPGGAVFSKSAPPGCRRQNTYKTGDLGRRLPDGNIEYLGRNDDQVQIRGFRIEPAEIESVMLKHPGIKETVVATFEDKHQQPFLCAYLRLKPGESLPEMRDYLSNMLPQYMIPAYFVPVKTIPLTPNGKLDKAALPAPQTVDDKKNHICPRSHLEETLAGIWAEVLAIKRETTGIDDNFFHLGGHSLKAALMISKIHKEINIKVPLAQVFKTPSIRGIADWIAACGDTPYLPIPCREQQEYYDVSHAQERVWALSQLEAASISFNMPMVHLLAGELHILALEQTLQSLTVRHESLRTIFLNIEGEVKQKILPPEQVNFSLEHTHLENVPEKEAKARELVEYESGLPFDLVSGPLLKVRLIRLEKQKHVFFFNMHHIISDFLSLDRFIDEMQILYDVFDKGTPNPLKTLPIQYKDYAAWHNKHLTAEQLNQHQEYWMKQLTGKPPPLELPLDHQRPAVQTYNGDEVTDTIEAAFLKKLRTFSETHRVTLFMTLLATLNLLFYYYTGQTDILLGTVSAGRDHPDLQDQIGFYLNTLVLRTRFDPGDTFAALLRSVKAELTNAFVHQVYPFDQLLENLGEKRDIARHPIFDVMVDMVNYNSLPGETSDQGGTGNIQVKNFGLNSTTAKFDLTIYLIESENTMDVRFEYNTDLFAGKTIANMVERFVKLLETILDNPDTIISKLRLKQKRQAPIIQRISRNI